MAVQTAGDSVTVCAPHKPGKHVEAKCRVMVERGLFDRAAVGVELVFQARFEDGAPALAPRRRVLELWKEHAQQVERRGLADQMVVGAGKELQMPMEEAPVVEKPFHPGRVILGREPRVIEHEVVRPQPRERAVGRLEGARPVDAFGVGVVAQPAANQAARLGRGWRIAVEEI